MYAAYAHAWPVQAHAMLGRLGRDRQLGEKLLQAAEEYVPGGCWTGGGWLASWLFGGWLPCFPAGWLAGVRTSCCLASCRGHERCPVQPCIAVLSWVLTVAEGPDHLRTGSAVAGMLPDGLMLSQPISRRSSLGNSGAATPRGGLQRTSTFPVAAVSQPQQQGGGGAVRLAPVVPKLALYNLGSAAGSTRASPSRPSSAHTAARTAVAPAAVAASLAPPAAAWQQQPAAVSARENQPDNRGAAVHATPRSMFPKTRARQEAAAVAADCPEPEPEPSMQAPAAARDRPAARRSMGGAALRMSVASFRVRRLRACLLVLYLSASAPPLVECWWCMQLLELLCCEWFVAPPCRTR